MIRPLVLSAFCSFSPLLFYGNFFYRAHILALITTSILHHSYFKKDGLVHKLDTSMAYLFVFHNIILFHDFFIFREYLLYVIILYLIAMTTNVQHDTLRGWNNIMRLSPHILLHITTGVGIYKSYTILRYVTN